MKFRSCFLFLLFLICAFIFDSQISLLLGDFLPKPYLFSSYTSFIVLLYFEKQLSSWVLYSIVCIFAALADGYFYRKIGLSLFVYPILVYLIKKHRGLISIAYARFFMLLALIIIFEGGVYTLAWFYGLTKYPIDLAIAYHLLPTLIFNSFVLWIISPIFKKSVE